MVVSTHSRPKAAGTSALAASAACCCFNTQPPEGGWGFRPFQYQALHGFNTQPPEGGWKCCLALLN